MSSSEHSPNTLGPVHGPDIIDSVPAHFFEDGPFVPTAQDEREATFNAVVTGGIRNAACELNVVELGAVDPSVLAANWD
mgnify:CR=1 FL=1